MKLNAGIITSKLKEVKEFYVNKLGFGVTHEMDWYLQLHTPNKQFDIGFLEPNHETQNPLFQPEFANKGVWFTIELEDVDAMYEEIQKKGIPIVVSLRDEPWGERHFSIVDPIGIGIDFTHYTPPTEDK